MGNVVVKIKRWIKVDNSYATSYYSVVPFTEYVSNL